MPTVSPENNKFIYSRIVFELADAIKAADNNMLHIDDAIIVAATPAVLLNYKSIDEKDLKRIMLPLKRFFKHNPRFPDFKKAAVAQGLREEWLPTLEDDFKASLLADFGLTAPGVTEDGYVIFNEQIFDNLTKSEHPDRERYGAEDYTPRPARKSASRRNKVLLTSVAPDAKLSDKLVPYIDWYKKNWEYLHPLEDYKWEAIKHFQELFDINAEDIAANLKEAFRKANNLLSGSMYTPLAMLVKHAVISPDDVRMALVNLYDESKPLHERSATFLDDMATIHKRNVEAGHFRPTDRDMQSERSNSVYLAFMYPDKHYLYKSSMWLNFKDEVELDYPPLTQFVGKLAGYEMILDQIRDVLVEDDELLAMLAASQPEDNYAGHLLTQDFIYCVAIHLLNNTAL